MVFLREPRPYCFSTVHQKTRAPWLKNELLIFLGLTGTLLGGPISSFEQTVARKSMILEAQQCLRVSAIFPSISRVELTKTPLDMIYQLIILSI